LACKDLYYKQGGTVHFNVKFKSGGLPDRLVATEGCGLKQRKLKWIYLVEEKRQATPDEIRQLCKDRSSK